MSNVAPTKKQNCIPHRLPGSSFFSAWDFSSLNPNPCLSFSGIFCSPDSLRVIILSLGDSSGIGPSLVGFLHRIISSLPALTQLLLSPGVITGPIPSELGFFRKLYALFLSRNRLTGPPSLPPSPPFLIFIPLT